MTMRKEDKRNARRIQFDQPVAATLSHVPVTLVDLSTSGARLSHESHIPFIPGKRYSLEVLCDGEIYNLNCRVVRSRMEQTHQRSSRRLTYTSGVLFVDLTEESLEQLWGLIALLAIDVLEHEAHPKLVFDFEIMQ